MKHCAILLLPCLLTLAGCGKSAPDKFQVTGAVTYQGKPLPVGSVMFVPRTKSQKAATAAIGANGRYQLEAAPGEYAVEVQMAARLRGQPMQIAEGQNLDVKIPEVDWLIPEKYSHFQTSGLNVVVEPGKNNSIDLPMQ